MTTAVHLDYATRDYDGFRQLMLAVIDRQDTAWTERAAADVGVMVVELLAYELDRLAYAGDRVAEESFLATARRWESARRHAALGDYVLDRGNATRGYQWFQLADGQAAALAVRSQVAAPADPRDPNAPPVIAETLDPAQLDSRRNWFALAQSAPVGTSALRLTAGDGSQPDLRTLGVAAGMTLIIGLPVVPGPGLTPITAGGTLQLARGEVVTIASVMPHGVELTQPLAATWPGGSDGAWVLGNVVEVRLGQTSAWTTIGRGGAALGDVASDQLMQLRMAVVRQLRDEVEDARALWTARPALHAQWTAACQAITQLVAQYDAAGPDQRAAMLAAPGALTTAAAALRAILTAIGHDVPDALAASASAVLPDQTIDLPMLDQPVLWSDADPVIPVDGPARSETLAVAVGTAGAWTRWTEQPDLLRSAPDDLHYVVELDGNAQITLRFGDGVTGAALPADSQVMARWVAGDDSGGDLRAGALSVPPPGLAAIVATSNPLPTAGGRAPEDLDGLAARVELGLQLPAIPVTASDYQALALEQAGVGEVAVAAVDGAVDLVIRPAPGAAPGALLAQVEAWADATRLAGTSVTVRLPRPLAIDIGLVVDVHPDVSADDLRYRVQRALVGEFGDAQPVALGRTRERAEVYRVVEQTPGVLWSQLVVFDRAGGSAVLEQIAPARDELVRVGGLDDTPAAGQITMWTARRYALQLAVGYDTIDRKPDFVALGGLIASLLSGPGSLPVTRGWTTITAAQLDAALAGVFAGAGFTVTVSRLIADRRRVREVVLGARELPILDSAPLVDAGLAKGNA